MSEPLAVHVSRYLQDPEAFEASLDVPVIVFEPAEEEEPTLTGDEEEYRLKTQTAVSAATLRLPSAEGPIVFAVKKVGENAFKRGVTIGRTSNNDIVLDDGSVSRFHAWILKDPDTGRWTITDAGSKNGTFVHGVQLEPRRPLSLGERVRLKFGQVDVTLYAPRAFLELVKRRAPRT